jgi:cytochrome P450/ferredoxin-NADP reductase
MTLLDALPLAGDDLLDPDALRRERERGWAARSPRGIEVFAYDQGMQVLEHPGLLKGPSFQYRLDQLGISGEPRRYMDMGITNKEGEERRLMRASFGALFRPTVVARLRQSVRAIAHDVLDEIDDPADFDLMRLCWEIPARTYCEMVSIPHSESHTVIRIADSVLGTLLNVDVTRREEAEAAILESVGIVREHLDARRGDLGDDFTSVMIRQQVDGLMTEEQLVAQSFAILQASVDNTAHQMGNTFGALLEHPERWQQFLGDRSLRGPIIEEIIRLHPRFGTIFRLADRDVQLDGLEIPEGTWTFVSARAGQRDPLVFDDPDEYRLDRPDRRPLMFGAGPYNCLGQNLARIEIEEALDAVADRFPQVALRGSWARRQANAVSETKSLAVDLGRSVPRAAAVAASETAGLAPGESALDCEVAALESVADGVLAVTLRSRGGGELPSWQPGSHVDLVLPTGLTRQYSLCGPQEDSRSYRVAVLRERDGTGGSAFVHDRLVMGDALVVRGPRNNFELEDAPVLRFVAGGIGITAILPMVHEAQRRGADWSLVYLGRQLSGLAFLTELADLPAERVRVVATAVEGRPAPSELAEDYTPGALLYACGPASLLRALGDTGWPEDALRVERFEPDAEALAAPRAAFEVQLALDGRSLVVPAEKSILDVVEEAGIAWPYSCREGTCGSCETRIVAGRADHRDAILTPAERRRNEYLMICVSRAASPSLELEI